MERIIPFPQADDFQKVIVILNLNDELFLNNNEILSKALGEISERQVAYYLNAVEYLGLIEKNNNIRVYTDLAKQLRQNNAVMQKAELISIILQDRTFSLVYALTKMFGEQEVDDVAEIVEQFHEGYSKEIYKRRAQTVLKWIQWINRELEE